MTTMSSQQHLPQTLTTMEACFTLHEDSKMQEEFWRHQQRMGPIAAAAPGFLGVIGGPIQRSNWLYFCGKWKTPDLMDQWQFDSKHTPMQKAAHARWFASMYIRKWRLPDTGEQLTGPLFCEVAIARQTPLEAGTVDKILDEIVGPSLREHGALPFETMTGVFEAQPYQFVGPLQEFPALAPTRYLLLTHWPTNDALQDWLRSGVIKYLSDYGAVATNVSIQIKHDPGERKFMREDGLQREVVHA
jgi:hypothetical protein